jgi:hypothetical protein
MSILQKAGVTTLDAVTPCGNIDEIGADYFFARV